MVVGVAVEGARGKVRSHERLLSVRLSFDLLQLGERCRHLVGRQVGTPVAALSEVKTVRVPGRQAHDARTGATDPDRWAWLLRRLRRAYRVVDPVVLAVVGRALVLPEPAGDLEAVPELVHTIAGRWEVVPVRAVFIFLPARADPEIEPAPGHVSTPAAISPAVPGCGTDGGTARRAGSRVLARGGEQSQLEAIAAGVPPVPPKKWSLTRTNESDFPRPARGSRNLSVVQQPPETIPPASPYDLAIELGDEIRTRTKPPLYCARSSG